MGVVYEAEAIRLGKRPCAIKVLLPEFTRNETVVARFEREAEVAARVKHPNVVEIFDTGQTAAASATSPWSCWSARPSTATLREGPAAVERVPEAPPAGLRRPRGRPRSRASSTATSSPRTASASPPRATRTPARPRLIKVLDFGIAKLADIDGDVEAARLTATNSVIGTYAYMSLRADLRRAVDHRVDVWAVGVMLYELLTGRLPFRGRNQGQIWKAISSYDPEPLASVAPDAGIPADVDDIVRRTLARALPDRFPSIAALAQALAAVPDGPASASPSRPRLPGPVIVVDPLATTHSHTAGPVPADSRHDRFVRVRDLVLAGALFIALQVVVAAIAVFVGIRLLAP
jgi:serine/threonine protein kinase